MNRLVTAVACTVVSIAAVTAIGGPAGRIAGAVLRELVRAAT